MEIRRGIRPPPQPTTHPPPPLRSATCIGQRDTVTNALDSIIEIPSYNLARE